MATNNNIIKFELKLNSKVNGKNQDLDTYINTLKNTFSEVSKSANSASKDISKINDDLKEVQRIINLLHKKKIFDHKKLNSDLTKIKSIKKESGGIDLGFDDSKIVKQLKRIKKILRSININTHVYHDIKSDQLKTIENNVIKKLSKQNKLTKDQTEELKTQTSEIKTQTTELNKQTNVLTKQERIRKNYTKSNVVLKDNNIRKSAANLGIVIGAAFNDRLTFAILNFGLLAGTMYKLTSVFNMLIEQGYEFAKEIEVQKIGITGLLTATNDLKDANGNYVTGVKKIQYEWKESEKIMKKMIQVNREVPASLDQLIRTYRAIYATASAANMSQQQMIKLVKLFTLTQAASGVQFDAFLATVDGVIDGTYRLNTEYGRVLKMFGITPAVMKKIKEEGGDVFKFLEERLGRVEDVGKQFMNTMAGIDIRLKNTSQIKMQKVTESWFELVKSTKLLTTELIEQSEILESVKGFFDDILLNVKDINREMENTNTGWFNSFINVFSYKASDKIAGTHIMEFERLNNKLKKTIKFINNTEKALSNLNKSKLKKLFDMNNELQKIQKDMSDNPLYYQQNAKALDEANDKIIILTNSIRSLRNQLKNEGIDENLLKLFTTGNVEVNLNQLREELITQSKNAIDFVAKYREKYIKYQKYESMGLDGSIVMDKDLVKEYELARDVIKATQEQLINLNKVYKSLNDGKPLKIFDLKNTQAVNLKVKEANEFLSDLNEQLKTLKQNEMSPIQINNAKIKELKDKFIELSKELNEKDKIAMKKKIDEVIAYIERKNKKLTNKLAKEKGDFLKDIMSKGVDKTPMEKLIDEYNNVLTKYNWTEEEKLQITEKYEKLIYDEANKYLEKIDKDRQKELDREKAREIARLRFKKRMYLQEKDFYNATKTDIELQKYNNSKIAGVSESEAAQSIIGGIDERLKNLQFNKPSDIMDTETKYNQDLEQMKALFEAKIQLLEEQGAKEEEIEKIKQEKIRQIKLKEFEKDKELSQMYLGNAGQLVQGIMALGPKYAKKYAAAYKAIAVSQATISMWVGATRALELPFPQNVAEMAKVIGLGMQNIAAIQAQKFHTGGYIRPDEQPAILQKGEAVLTQNGVSNLIKNINQGGDMGNANSTPEVYVYFDRDKLMEDWATSRSGNKVIKKVVGK